MSPPWFSWSLRIATIWSLGYAALGVTWMLGGPGFPFGRANDPSAEITAFSGLEADVGGAVIAGLGLVGGLVVLTLARRPARGPVRSATLGSAWALAILLILVVPDYRPLLATAYAPIILVGAPFGWPPDVALGDVFPWPVVNQLVCIVGGVAWAGTAIASGRIGRGACLTCGRAGEEGWTSPSSATRWGRWVTAVAVAIPLLYAATRYAWALGIPLGISESFFREGQAIGLWFAGAALASLAVGGALLTTGLALPWGTRFPSWIPRLAGHRVPPLLAIVPATVVALLVTSAGLMFVRILLAGAFTDVFEFGADVGWVALAPELLWPVWGVALVAATLAYHYRRRGRCEVCGRG